MSGFSYRDMANIIFTEFDREYFESLFGDFRDIKNTSMVNYDISSWDKYRYPTKLEDIYGLERSKKWYSEFRAKYNGF